MEGPGIPEWSEDSSVLILGEKHGNSESQKLTVALVKGKRSQVQGSTFRVREKTEIGPPKFNGQNAL
jgi:hypothetical protein